MVFLLISNCGMDIAAIKSLLMAQFELEGLEGTCCYLRI